MEEYYIYEVVFEGELSNKYFMDYKIAEKYLKTQGYFYKKVNYGGYDYFDDCNKKARINTVFCPLSFRHYYEIIDVLEE